jgi:hypothetical protein
MGGGEFMWLRQGFDILHRQTIDHFFFAASA